MNRGPADSLNEMHTLAVTIARLEPATQKVTDEHLPQRRWPHVRRFLRLCIAWTPKARTRVRRSEAQKQSKRRRNG